MKRRIAAVLLLFFPLFAAPLAAQTLSRESVITLVAAGDNLIHNIIYWSARIPGGEKGKERYNFDSCYRYIKPIIESADIAFVNQETVMAGDGWKISSYPAFNTPQEAGLGLINAGFDVINLASNHTLDIGSDAAFAALDFWESHRDVNVLGLFRSPEQRKNKRVIIEKKGIKVGFLSYTYGLNGYTLPLKNKAWMIAVIDREIMAAEIDALRPLCDILVVSMHWGTEWSHTVDSSQKETAAFLAAHNVDLVIGHHPHVTQGVEIIPRSDGGKLVCYYSLGDLLSHTQNEKTPDTILGALALVTIKKKYPQLPGPGPRSVCSITDAGVIPIVNHYPKGKAPDFTVYPLWDYTKELAAAHYKSRSISPDYLWKVSRDIFGLRIIGRR